MITLGFLFAIILCIIVTLYAIAAVFGSIILTGKCPIIVLVLALVIPSAAWYLTITNSPFTIIEKQQGGAE